MSDGRGGMGGSEFGQTWWGQAWLEALEQRAGWIPTGCRGVATTPDRAASAS